MPVRSSTYLVLGMLRLGASSGYAIKKAADVSTRFFWATSFAQVYPELARLERERLVTRRDEPRGARRRSAYQVTGDGERALLAWLRSPRQAPPQFRVEGILRLFLADALPAEDQRALVRRLAAESSPQHRATKPPSPPVQRRRHRSSASLPARPYRSRAAPGRWCLAGTRRRSRRAG